MHEHKSHGHSHHRQEQDDAPDELRKLQSMLEHWIEHSDSHGERYLEWAAKASAAGEEEIARELHLAVSDSETVKKHFQRAKAILAAKLVLKRKQR